MPATAQTFVGGFVWGAGFTVAWVVIHILLHLIGVQGGC